MGTLAVGTKALTHPRLCKEEIVPALAPRLTAAFFFIARYLLLVRRVNPFDYSVT